MSKRALPVSSSVTFNNHDGNDEGGMNPEEEGGSSTYGPLLRIRRRRRGEIIATTLRMELADNNPSTLLSNIQLSSTNSNHENNIITASSHSTNATTVIWKRVEIIQGSSNCGDLNQPSKESNNKNKRPRIVDAVLLDNHPAEKNSDSPINNCSNHPKRRKLLKLQLLEPSSSNHSLAAAAAASQTMHSKQSHQTQIKKKNAYPILSPEKRIVDDSLQQLLQGNITIEQHCALLRDQSKKALHQNVNHDKSHHSSSVFWPWTFCDSSQQNTWLHACAYWNEGPAAQIQLEQLHRQIINNNNNMTEGKEAWICVLRQMMNASNADGFTPYQLAKHLRHDTIELILDSYMSQLMIVDDPNMRHSTTATGQIKNDDDENSWEYDLYRIVDHRGMVSSSSNTTTTTECRGDDDDHSDERILDCELHDRCTGYFDQHGELVLEPESKTIHNASQSMHLLDNDDDWDSNDEDCFANDYPDEQDEDDWSQSSNSTNTSREVDASYRHRPFVVSQMSEAYDAAYGICDQRDIEFDDECE